MDEQNIVYPVGSNIVVYNTESKTQKFINVTEAHEEITSVAISPNKKYLAVGERSEGKPLVAIYDIHTARRKKVLTPTEGEPKVFINWSV